MKNLSISIIVTSITFEYGSKLKELKSAWFVLLTFHSSISSHLKKEYVFNKNCSAVKNKTLPWVRLLSFFILKNGYIFG